MRILFLSAWCPFPPDNGAKLRIAHLLRGLAHEHTVDLIAFAPEAPGDAALHELHTLCGEVELLPGSPFDEQPVHTLRLLTSAAPRSILQRYNPAVVAAVRRRAARGYDLVIASQIHMAPYALEVPDTPRVFEEVELALMREKHTYEQPLLQRVRLVLMWWKQRRYVQRLLRSFQGVTVASEPEMQLLRPLTHPALYAAVVPNGVDTAACGADFGPPEPDLLIHPGALSWEANADAMAYFLADIWPRIRAARPQARLQITGRSTPEQIAALPRAEGIEFTGYLDDVRAAVARAWAEVVPLRIGGGTRLKVLEALALGTPVIATSKGVEGIDLQPGRDVLVADTSQAFAEQTQRLLESPALRAALAANGRHVAARYDWSHSVARLLDVVEHAARAGRRGQAAVPGRSPGTVVR